MTNLLIVLMGKNLQREDGSGILSEAIAAFPDREVVIVRSNRERLSPPKGYECISVDEVKKLLCSRQETQDWDVVMVANGGQTAQAIPVVVALASGYDGYWGTYKIVNLQRDGVEVLAEEKFSKTEDSIPLDRASEEQVRYCYNNTSW